MTPLQLTLTIIGTVLTILGLLMAFARTGPEEAKKNLLDGLKHSASQRFRSGRRLAGRTFGWPG
jgi:hypothetical protein